MPAQAGARGSWSSRRGMRDRCRARVSSPDGLADRSVDPGGQEDDEDDQQQTVDRVGHAQELEPEADAQAFRERRRQRGAYQRAHHRVHAPQHHREDDLQRDADARERVWVDVGHVLGVEDPAQGGERRRDHRDAELEARYVDAHRGRRRLVLADGLERRARHAPVHAVPHPEAGEKEGERGVVEDALVRGLQRPQPGLRAGGLEARAERAAGPVALGDDEEADDLPHGQCHQREVVADDAEAETGDAEHDRDHDRRGHGEHRADPGRERVEVPQQRRRVRAHPEEGAVAERYEAEAAHEGPGLADEGPDEDLDGHVQHVLPHAAHGHGGGGQQEEQDGPRQSPAACHSRLARMPPGRTNIMTMKMTKAMTYPISVEITTPPIAMISLMMNDAMKAPTMLPRPPSTQIMNVSGPNCPPKKGCTEYWKMRSAPASPAMRPPTAEVTR